MRFLSRLLFIAVLLFAGGFALFVSTLPRAGQYDVSRLEGISPKETGIVVLTGGRGDRIAEAFSLYAEGRADRLLISGTHPDVRKVDLAERFDPETLDCCVDLDPVAQTTIGNAREAKAWANANGYRGIYLVTHDYHLSRAMMEMKFVAKDIEIVGVAVASDDIQQRWGLLLREYTKLVLTGLRTIL